MQRSKAVPPLAAEATGEAGRPAARRGYGLKTFSPLGYRDFRLLWFGSLFSSSGLWIQQVSIGWLTYDITGSAFLLGAVNGLRSVPLLFLGPFGGVAADRMERRRLMLVTQVFLMAVTAGFATIAVTGHAHLWNLILFTVLTGVGWAFNMPVRQSVVPNLVPREDLPKAIALNSMGVNMTRIVGPSLAGLLIAWVGVGENFYLQSLAYLGIAVMVWRMRVPPVARPKREESVLSNLAEGARYVWREPFLRVQMGLALIPVLVALPFTSLMPIFAKDVLGVGPLGFGVLMAAPGVGAVLGMFGIASLGNIERRGRLLLSALVGFGASLVLFSFSRSYPLSLLVLLFAGAFQFMYLATNQTLLQLATPDGFRGRVMGMYMLNQGLLPLGSLFAGSLAALLGAPSAVFIMGASLLSLCLLAFVSIAPVRALYNRAT